MGLDVLGARLVIKCSSAVIPVKSMQASRLMTLALINACYDIPTGA